MARPKRSLNIIDAAFYGIICLVVLTIVEQPLALKLYFRGVDLLTILLIFDTIGFLIVFQRLLRAPFARYDRAFDIRYENTANRGTWRAKSVILMILAAFLVIEVSNRLAALLPNKYEEAYEQAFDILLNNSNIVSGFLVIVIMGPLFEEAIIRGVIFRGLRSHMGFWIPALVSSLAWAVWHMDLVQGVSTFFTGLLLALLYEKTRNLIVPFAVHAVNNLAGFLGIGLLGAEEQYSAVNFLILAVEAVLAVLVFIKVKGRKVIW